MKRTKILNTPQSACVFVFLSRIPRAAVLREGHCIENKCWTSTHEYGPEHSFLTHFRQHASSTSYNSRKTQTGTTFASEPSIAHLQHQEQPYYHIWSQDTHHEEALWTYFMDPRGKLQMWWKSTEKATVERDWRKRLRKRLRKQLGRKQLRKRPGKSRVPTAKYRQRVPTASIDGKYRQQVPTVSIAINPSTRTHLWCALKRNLIHRTWEIRGNVLINTMSFYINKLSTLNPWFTRYCQCCKLWTITIQHSQKCKWQTTASRKYKGGDFSSGSIPTLHDWFGNQHG